MIRNLFILLIAAISVNFNVLAQQQDTISPPKVDVSYTSKGFQFKTNDDKFMLRLASRLQFRFSHPGDQDPLTFEEDISDKTVFKINRARLKVGGHGFSPDLKYYWEFELARSRLLDFRLMFEKLEEFNVKVGQWKIYYTRERVISSGKQQMVDRSIINRPFTIDRQQGISFYGRLFRDRLADLTYHISIVTGSGRGSFENDDKNLMYVGRFQWNFIGPEIAMTSSDLTYHEKPAALIAVAAATNRSQFTRFSTSGGGQLVGFEDGVPGQYRINQGLIETAFMYKGFSWQNEIHFKEIKDSVNDDITPMRGSYYQAGYFLNGLWDAIPEPLEMAFRYARFTPDNDLSPFQEEFSLAFNWFFKGHRNKLTAEVSGFDFEDQPGDLERTYRFRVQWDISF